MTELSFSLESVPKLKRFIQDKMGPFDFSHVWVSRCYHDGRYIDICTDPIWKQTMLQHKWNESCAQFLYSPAINGSRAVPKESNTLTELFWSSELTQIPPSFQAIRHMKNVKSGSNVIFHYPDYIESYGFASTQSLNVFQSLILENKQNYNMLVARLRVFSNEIFKSPNLMYAQISKNWYQKKNCLIQKHDIIQSDPFPIVLFGKTYYLTRRQIQFLNLASEGKTFYYISDYMGIVPRSVEHYALKLRQIIQNKNLNEILIEYHNTGFFSLFRSLSNS